MIKPSITLVLAFLWQLSLAQQTIKPSDLPVSLWGDYNNSNGEWTMGLNPDFVMESSYMFCGYYEKITHQDGIYTFYVNAIDLNRNNYQFQLKLGGKDTIWLAVEQIKGQFLPYRRIPSDQVQYPNPSEIIQPNKGKWYATDGSNQVQIEFFDGYCVLEKEKYTYSRYIKIGDTRQLNISGSRFGRYIHFNGSGNYLNLEVLGKGWLHVKRKPEMPNQEGISFDQVPAALLGKWYSTTNTDGPLQLLPSYQIIINYETLPLNRLWKEGDKVCFSFTRQGKEERFGLREKDSQYSQLFQANGESAFVKRSTKLPNGIAVENTFQSNWYACDDASATLVITAQEIKSSQDTQLPSPYTSVLFDGMQYKFMKGKKVVVYLKKINADYVEMASQPSEVFRLYKKKASLPNQAIVALPKELLTNWLNKQTGQWQVGFMPNTVLFQSDFWDYTGTTYKDGVYTVYAEKSDTVCFLDASGNKVCKVVPKKARFNLRKKGDGQIVVSMNGGQEVVCTNSIYTAGYTPSFTLPKNSQPGIAILKGYVKNIPESFKNSPIEVIVNDLFYNTQVNYSTKIDSSGKFTLSIPLTTPQDIYLKHTSSFTSSFLIPCDTLLLCVDGANMGDKWPWMWMGQAAEINRDMIRFMVNPEYEAHNRNRNEQEIVNLALEPEEFKEARKKVEKDNFAFYTKQAAVLPLSPGFKVWYETNLRMTFFEDLIRYPWLRSNAQRPELVKHPTYFTFLDSLDMTDPQYWISGRFAFYTHNIYMHYASPIRTHVPENLFWQQVIKTDKALTQQERVIIRPLATPTEDKDSKVFMDLIGKHVKIIAEQQEARKKPNLSSVEILDILKKEEPSLSKAQWQQLTRTAIKADDRNKVLNPVRERNQDLFTHLMQETHSRAVLDCMATQKYGSFLKQLALNKQFYKSIEDNDIPRMESFWKQIQASELNKSIKHHLELAYTKTKEDLAKPLPEYAKLNNTAEGSADEWLKNLALKHPGKTLYIDVWAPWCGPCRQEMAQSPAMKAACKGKEVVFVYLCGSGGKPAWENCIKKYAIDGDHYYVSDATYADFCAKFGISGIPSYLIMNRQGQVVNKNAPRPSDLPTLLTELDKHLR
ncbi:MAG: TlpA disulfide reductase family protein [Bacteroidota bacterium]